jgi:hypothetical protein
MSKVINVDGDLPMKLADVFQGVDDALEVLEGAFALTDLNAGQDDDEDGDVRDTALVALRWNVIERFRKQRDALEGIVRALGQQRDPDAEAWLRRQLAGLAGDSSNAT